MHRKTPAKSEGQLLDPMIRFKDQGPITGLGRTTAYTYIKQGIMPAPIQLGPRACGWRLSTLRAWLIAREQVIKGDER